MNKNSIADIAIAISNKHGINEESAKKFITDFFDLIGQGLNTDKIVKVRGLGTFKIVDVHERESVNVNTGERVTIEEHSKINFTPDPIIRDLVNKPFAKFETVVLNDGIDIDELNKLNESIDSDDLDFANDGSINITDDNKNEELDNKDEELENNDNVIENSSNIDSSKNLILENNIDEHSTQCNESETDIVENHETIENFLETNEQEEQLIELDDDSCSKENINQEIEEENYLEDENRSSIRSYRFLVKIVYSFIIAIISFAGGYLLGQKYASRPIFKTVKVYKILKKDNAKTDSCKTDLTKIDTFKIKSDQIRKEEKTSLLDNNKSSLPEEKTNNTKALLAAKRQVRTGAYNIIGTDRTVIVKKGQTMKRLSKIYLGEGMECYIQVHNGIDELTEGMNVKIPKLKLKKHQ